MDKQENRTSSYAKRIGELFQSREALGGLMLLGATVMALVWANTRWEEFYHTLWRKEFSLSLSGGLGLSHTLELWINDGLMVVFFLVAGMEMKREVMVGELTNFRKASLPIWAALGGMILPALIYISFNLSSGQIKGWGIPMATDIAYSLGILSLCVKTIPKQGRIFLTALAIADDLGAILVIAFFYSSDISWYYLTAASAIFGLLIAINKVGVKDLWPYLVLGVGLWYCFLNSGVHATIAGVLLASTIPIHPKLSSQRFKSKAQEHITQLEETNLEDEGPFSNEKQQDLIEKLHKESKEAHPPLLRLENILTPWNAYFIIPLFAFANAGVTFEKNLIEVLTTPVGSGIALGLLCGKPLGILLFCWISLKIGLAQSHESLKWGHIAGLGLLAGIGFTMSLFITSMAFEKQQFVSQAKVSILIASTLAAVAGSVVLNLTGKKKDVNS
jgi:Na+:H+ antiporter, NhaA family